jgi:hypothetical protein
VLGPACGPFLNSVDPHFTLHPRMDTQVYLI